MTAVTDTRKRSREDDNCDFMPLSKRINNLHINTQVSVAIIPQMTGFQHIALRETYRDIDVSSNDQHSSYDPGISSSQSSYYFDNKLLYELYIERLQRNGLHSPY